MKTRGENMWPDFEQSSNDFDFICWLLVTKLRVVVCLSYETIRIAIKIVQTLAMEVCSGYNFLEIETFTVSE